nr:MAG TPA: hypothetical protein [Caudoviricetes sp.]
MLCIILLLYNFQTFLDMKTPVRSYCSNGCWILKLYPWEQH